MRKLSLLITLLLGGMLLGCTSAEEKQVEEEAQKEQVSDAQADPNEKKQALYAKYTDCINSAGGIPDKLRECDKYLDEMKALK